MKDIASEFKGKRILVTGGTGSIGSVIVRELLKYKPKQIRVFSRDETKQFELSHMIGFDKPVNFLIGDIRNKDRLIMAMENIDIVFHAAALKHVSSCEKNSFEAVNTNVLGTQNVIDAAFHCGVDKVIGISTDKATDPTNVMGATKLLAERLILSTYFYKGNKKTKFAIVRFGNVLGSRGSVVPLFKKQIKEGKPITITDPQMTRFFMSIPEAVNIVFKAMTNMQDREIFVFKMPVLTIGDLAEAVKQIAEEKKLSDKKIEIKTIGKKHGERVHEKLLTEGESEKALETDEMFIILPDPAIDHILSYRKVKPHSYKNAKKVVFGEYRSETQPKLSIKEIKKLLQSNNLI